jgi:hypothetical protein
VARIAALSIVLAATSLAGPAAATEFPPTPSPQAVPSTPDADGAHLAIGLQGQSVAVWRRNTGTGLIIDSAVRPAGGPWVAMPGVATGSSGDVPRVRLDGLGRATLLAVLAPGFQTASLPPGGVWSASRSIAINPDPTHGISVGPGGRVLVAQTKNTGEDPAQPITIQASMQPGPDAAFEPIEDVFGPVTGSSEHFSPTAATFAGARAVLAWANQPADKLQFAIREPGDTAFGTAADADTTAGNKLFPRLVAAPNGDVHLLYWEKVASDWELHHRVLPAGSTTFGAQETAATKPGATAPFDQPAAMSIDGELTALFRQDDGQLRAVTRPPGQAWSPIIQFVAADFVVNADPVYAFDGTLVVSYGRGAGPTPAVTMKPPGGDWSPPLGLSNEQGVQPSLAVGPTGDAMVLWNTADGRVLASIGDSGEPPSLQLNAPASFRFGQPFSTTLAATDFSGIASTGFAFSDGADAGGASATHTFDRQAPRYQVTASATDMLGNVARATRDLVPQVTPICACVGDPTPGPRPRRTRRPDTDITRFRSPIRSRALREFRGTASDDLGLAAVDVALVRLSGGARFTASAAARRCFALRSSGRVTRTTARRGACRPAAFLRATGTTRWRFRLKRRLPRGSYAVVARARATDGTVERGFSARDRNLIRFKIK